MDTSGLTLGLAFFAGLASFLSPCVFALVPAYVGYLSGRTVAAANGENRTSSVVTVLHGFAFVIGFSAVFVLLGALAAALGGILFDITAILVKVGGVVIVIFGLHMLHVINIPYLNYDLRPQSPVDRQRGYLSSALMGVFFSAGWAPCVGPILGTILTLSLNGGDPVQGATLLSAYSAGLGIPFLLAAAQIGWVTTTIRRYGKVMLAAERVMGVVLVAVGVLLFSGRFERLATLGFFFETFDEVLVGRLLLIGLLAAFVLGLIPALVARRRGRSFFDWWFLGAGVSLVLIIILFALGAFNSLIPFVA
jgi:cytochrome c-type biogenesis protein